MTDLDHCAAPCSPVTLSNKKTPSPIRACTHLHPSGSGRLGAAHGRRPADCRAPSQPAWRHANTTTRRPAPFVHADLKRD
jgi:hypothetical protein